MSDGIEIALVNQYSANIRLRAQQEGSILVPSFVTLDNLAAEKGFVDYIASVEAKKKTGRHEEVTITATPHERRKIVSTPYYVADDIDEQDVKRMLTDPASAYVKNHANALGRVQDDVVITALGGSAWSGHDGDTEETLPSVQKVAVTYHKDGTTSNVGLTLDKIRKAKKILGTNQVLNKGETPVFVYTSNQLDDLLGITEVLSMDYVTRANLESGEVVKLLGFNFVLSERLVSASSIRYCYAYVPSGITFGTSIAPRGKIVNNEANQGIGARRVLADLMVGATRNEEEKVVEVACYEA